MKKLYNYLRSKLLGNKQNLTEIKFTFDKNATNPSVTLKIKDLEDQTAQELAKIFYILQTGAAQQCLVEKIASISAEENILFLENVYDNFNKLIVSKNKEQNKTVLYNYPMIRPLAAFNNNVSNH